MSEVAKKLADFGAHQKSVMAEKREQQATEMRSRLADAGMLDFAESMKAEFGAKLTFARFGDVVIGNEPERGCTDFVLLDLEKQAIRRVEKRQC